MNKKLGLFCVVLLVGAFTFSILDQDKPRVIETEEEFAEFLKEYNMTSEEFNAQASVKVNPWVATISIGFYGYSKYIDQEPYIKINTKLTEIRQKIMA